MLSCNNKKNLLKFEKQRRKNKFSLFLQKKYNVKFLLMYIFCLNILREKGNCENKQHTFDELLKKQEN
jgi:hypothetical protein